MKGFLLALAGALLAVTYAYGNPLTPITPAQCSIPSGCNDINALIAQINTTSTQDTLNWSPGAETAVVTTINGMAQLAIPITFKSLTGSAETFTCTTNPVVTFYNCGTSTTCAAPTIIASVTVTAAGTAVTTGIAPTVAQVPAGNYVGWATSAGACTVLDIQGAAVGQ